MTKIILGSAIMISLLGVGCAHQQVRYDSSSTVTSEVQPGVGLEAHVNWVKIKGPKIDMEVGLSNTSTEYVRLDYNSFQVKYNGQTGMLNRHGDFMKDLNILGPHNLHKGYVYFVFPDNIAREGTATLTISPIYSSPSSEVAKESWRKLKPITLELPVAYTR